MAAERKDGKIGFRRFSYRTREEFLADLAALTPEIPFSADLSICAEAWDVNGFRLPNRLAIHPMEGADGEEDGSPGELTFRRYRRFAAGGAGLLWFEATAVLPQARANPRQLWLHRGNAGKVRRLREEALAARPPSSPRPYAVLQLTHSGRQSFPGSGPEPLVACPNPVLDRRPGRVLADDELARLPEAFAEAAGLAAEAGFDAVDIKACHGYLLGELLGARTRPGRYGGDFDHRVRLMLEIVDAVRAETGGRLALASRLGVWDSIPRPYGWGVSETDPRIPDFSEPLELVRLLAARGVRLFDVTCGNPYFNPHVNRPFDYGFYTPPEHPMLGAAKLLRAAQAVQAAAPEATVAGTGLSWYRQFGAQVAAGALRDDWFRLAGFGRQAFAYPDFARDILAGGLKPEKCCVACGNCTVIMRDGGRSGCLVRDKEIYQPIYRLGREGKAPVDMKRGSDHIP
jgi:2,4-dienoyl-CoA reductase-like NADH-dependent reductase (Old Yellow Enzyme family)